MHMHMHMYMSHVHAHAHDMSMSMSMCMCMYGTHHALVLEQALRRELLSRGGWPRRGNLVQVQGA